MVVKQRRRIRTASAAPEPWRFTVDEYERMGETCILPPDARTELLDGEVIEMSPIGRRYAATVTRTSVVLIRRLPVGALVRVQNPLRISPRAEPEPDILVVQYRADYYESGHPGPDDALLLIDVADSSFDFDQQRKLPLYAASGICEVWLVDLNRNVVLVHRAPRRRRYQEVRTVARGQTLTPLAFPDLTIRVEEILA